MWLYIKTKSEDTDAAQLLRRQCESSTPIMTVRSLSNKNQAFYIENVYDVHVILNGVNSIGEPIEPFVSVHTMRKAKEHEHGMDMFGYENIFCEITCFNLSDLDSFDLLYPKGAFGV